MKEKKSRILEMFLDTTEDDGEFLDDTFRKPDPADRVPLMLLGLTLTVAGGFLTGRYDGLLGQILLWGGVVLALWGYFRCRVWEWAWMTLHSEDEDVEDNK